MDHHMVRLVIAQHQYKIMNHLNLRLENNKIKIHLANSRNKLLKPIAISIQVPLKAI